MNRKTLSTILLLLLTLWGAEAHAKEVLVVENTLLKLPTMPATYQQTNQSIRLNAIVESIHQATLSAQTSGQVDEILVDAGDIVPAGATLLKINSRNQRAELEAAEAAVRAAEAELKDSQRSLDRTRTLFKKKLAPQQSLDSATSRVDIASATLESARARVNAAREQLTYTTAIAPYSGIVLEKLVNLGEIVAPGTPLFTGTSLDTLRIVTQVPQNDIPAVRNFRQATVTMPDHTIIQASGDDVDIFSYASANSATFKVRVNLPEKISDLYPGMIVDVSFKTGERRALSIPMSALIKRSELRAVYVTDNAGQLHFRQVREGRRLPNHRVEILSGLSAGELVVTSPERAIAQLTQTGSQKRAQ